MQLSKCASKWALIVVGVLVIGVVACSTTGSVSGRAETMGTSGSFTLAWGDGEVKLESAPAGAHLDVQFRDANLNPIGSPVTGIGPGDVVMIPAGSACFTASMSSSSGCTGCAVDNLVAPPSGARQLAHGQSLAPAEQWLFVFPVKAGLSTFAPDFGPLSNTYASFSFAPTGTPATHEELVAKVAPILLAQIGALPAVAPDTAVNFYSKAVPQADGARVFVADQTTAFEEFMLRINGKVIATLGYHSDLHILPNGWNVLEARLKESDFEGDGTEDFELVADTIDGNPEGLIGTATYQVQ